MEYYCSKVVRLSEKKNIFLEIVLTFFQNYYTTIYKRKSSMNVDDNTTLIFVILFLCMGTYSFIYLCVYFIELINVRIQVNEISPIMAT